MADPLSVLRQYNVNKKEIIERDNQIIFGDFSWNKNANTNYLTWKSKKEGGDKEYYTLESLLYILKHADLIHPVYVQQAADAGVQVVQRPARKELLAYLNGEIATSASIDNSAPIEIPTQVGCPTNHDELEWAAKKPRMENGPDVPKHRSEAKPMEETEAEHLAKMRTNKRRDYSDTRTFGSDSYVDHSSGLSETQRNTHCSRKPSDDNTRYHNYEKRRCIDTCSDSQTPANTSERKKKRSHRHN